jgi:hypothetical protein
VIDQRSADSDTCPSQTSVSLIRDSHEQLIQLDLSSAQSIHDTVEIHYAQADSLHKHRAFRMQEGQPEKYLLSEQRMKEIRAILTRLHHHRSNIGTGSAEIAAERTQVFTENPSTFTPKFPDDRTR